MKYFISLLFILISYTLVAQDGGLKGTILEDFSYEPIQYASLSLQLDGVLVAQTRADAKGSFLFMNIETGTYDLIISKSGLSPLKIINIFITNNKLSELNPTFEARGFDQDTVIFTYSDFHKKNLNSNTHLYKKCSFKKQLRAAKKLEKQFIH